MVFHAYKDEYSDVPLDNWYSTTDSALPGSAYEFDVRDLRKVLATYLDADRIGDIQLIRNAIEFGFLQPHAIPRFGND